VKICYFDAFSGIAGDMTVGALIDAGAPADAVIGAIDSLGIGARVWLEKVKRGGIAASKFKVEAKAASGHRHLTEILALIERASLTHGAALARDVFQTLGEAEAKVHGIPIDRVHFHEVGAADSIADIVGACVALDVLEIDEVHVSPINTGSGTVRTEHGVLPVPAPATALLLRNRPVYARGPELELTTPTGAALVAALAEGSGAMPPMRILSVGYGAGDRDFPEHANVLRAIIGEATRAPEATLVSVIESNIDDSTPQILGYVMERLIEAGALDASLTPIQMKKNRLGSLLRVIARVEDQERLARLIFAETSTLGVRIYPAERRVQERRVIEVETGFGKVRVKISENGFAPEYEDCRAIAQEAGVPLKEVIAAANLAYLNQTR
jgi:pyridinium-3,5-bisthiocarboxylic acid mononucleotide nickel chelatase